MKSASPYFQLFWSFFKIGAFTLGGGYAMIALFQREVVEKRRWMEEKEFLELLAIAQSAPGPIALNTAIFTGYKTKGIWGSFVAGLGMALPSFVAILLIVYYFTDYKEQPGVERVFKGIRPAVVALIVAPLWKMRKTAGISLKTIWIPVGVLLLISLVGVSPVYVILGTILTAVCCALWEGRRWKKMGGAAL
ncbi:MAG: chromate transporter [Prevotellaceae bacterium]|jgi:chromate transporter|nr:chromate transporter [Prevotellaceae bacterium]